MVITIDCHCCDILHAHIRDSIAILTESMVAVVRYPDAVFEH